MRQLALAIGLIMLIGAGAAAAENRLERGLRKLSPNEALVQLCNYTAMRRIRRDHHQYHPDRTAPEARGRVFIDKNTVKAKGAAFRSGHKWYALSYTCSGSLKSMKVLSFKYKIGAEIPQSKWALYRLWE